MTVAATGTLAGRILFITGASRGIGAAIALRAAADGANVVLTAKTARPHPKLPGTVYTVAEEVERAGGRALPIVLDVRDVAALATAVERAVETFGVIDCVINNASAISLTGTLDTPMKRFDLMFGVNVRATFACTQACLPHLMRASNPHVLNLAPPINLAPRWFENHTAYTMSKYGMSMCVLGMASELREFGVAVNALWPATVIATAALNMLGPRVQPRYCRKPEIVADAAHWILTQDAKTCSGNFFIDENVLREAGAQDFERYAVEPGTDLMPDLFLD